ncbi:MAG: UDP-N-acetylmuramoyl-L-alanine--D-glutamate ligase [Clostridiales bacterium]|nr:UDP-N-acetylmuramoyl-L-alanine--D-glutamate ligase [Clostridiales bacterium]
MYLKNQTFFVLGLSRSGKAAAEFLLSQGALVYIYDDANSERVEKTAQELEKKGAKRVVKEQLVKLPDVCDVLVLSPGIPIDHSLAVAFKRKKKAVIGETELAARYIKTPVVAVTGTNGKTTTVSMIAETLCKGGFNAKACGNIGTPMIEMREMDETGVAVAEISSFQMETLNSLCPHIAVVLNITEDHLNRHYNMENYVFLKAKLLKNLTESEFAVLNYDDVVVRGFAEKTKAKTVWFSTRERVQGAYFADGALYFKGEKILAATDMLTDGLHNVQNALACIAVAKIMGVKSADIAAVLTSFKGIKHRVEYIGTVNGVAYIDDSKGTNVDATVKAVSCMKKPTLLLLGGKNKGYDYAKLFAVLKKSAVRHAVLYGENRYVLLKSARENGFESVTVCENFTIAVKVASLVAKVDETVLLSPASASFDEFAGYEERGDRFVEIVRSLAVEPVEKPQEQNGNETKDGDLDERTE